MKIIINFFSLLAKPFHVLHVFTCLCVAKNAWRQNSCVLLVTLVVKPVRLDWQPVTSIRRGTESFVLKLKFVCNVKDTIDRCLFRPKTADHLESSSCFYMQLILQHLIYWSSGSVQFAVVMWNLTFKTLFSLLIFQIYVYFLNFHPLPAW